MEEAIKKSPYQMEGAKKVANPVVLEVNSRLKHVNAWIIWCDPNVSNVTTLSCRLKGVANWAKNCVDTTFKLYLLCRSTIEMFQSRDNVIGFDLLEDKMAQLQHAISVCRRLKYLGIFEQRDC